MPRIKHLFFLFLPAVIFTACSEGREDPIGPGTSGLAAGRLTKSGDGPNTVVTRANSDSAFQEINEELFTAYLKAVSALSTGPHPAEPVRMTGEYSGYAEVDGSTDLSASDMSFDFNVTFYDYSDSASTYIGGSMQYKGRASAVSYRILTRRLVVDGEIMFAGPFSGSVNYNRYLLLTEVDEGYLLSIFTPDTILTRYTPEGYLTFTSGGETFNVKPYPEL